MLDVIKFIGAVYGRSPYRGKTGPATLESRIRQASSEVSLPRFVQRLTDGMRAEQVDETILVGDGPAVTPDMDGFY